MAAFLEWSRLSGEIVRLSRLSGEIETSSRLHHTHHVCLRFITDPANVANLFGMGLVQFLGMQVLNFYFDNRSGLVGLV